MSIKKIGMVAIHPVIDPYADPFDHVYAGFGMNTGNMMFTRSVYEHLDAELSHVGFEFEPALVNDQFNALVIPAANWLGSHVEWDWFTDKIEQVQIPVVTIGLGVQASGTNASAADWNASSIRFAQTLASKADWLSVRGHYSLMCLNQIGVLNAVATGCPSLYRKFDFASVGEIDGGLIVQSTRYAASPEFAKQSSINRDLFRMSYENGLDMIYQSEPEEIEYALHGREAEFLRDDELLAKLSAIYAAPSTDALLDHLDEHAHAFTDLDQWSRFVRSRDGVVGTRLHGSILALNSGRPAVLFPHDTRTGELVDFASIPTAEFDACDWLAQPLIQQPFVADQMGAFYERRQMNSGIYRAFLEANNLPYKESALC